MAATVEIAGVGALCAFGMLLFFLFKLLLLDGHHVKTRCLDHTIWFWPSFFMNLLLLDAWVIFFTAILIKLLHSLFYFYVLYWVDNIVLWSEISACRIHYIFIFDHTVILKRRFIALRFLNRSCLIFGMAHWKITNGILISVLIQVIDLGGIILVQSISREAVLFLPFLYLVLDEYFSFLFFLLFKMLYRILNVNWISYSVDLIFILGLDIHGVCNWVITWLFGGRIKVDLASRCTQIIYYHVIGCKLTRNQLKGIFKHSFPAESGSFHGDIRQVGIICIKFEACRKFTSYRFLWHELALKIIEFEVKHGSSDLYDTWVVFISLFELDAILVLNIQKLHWPVYFNKWPEFGAIVLKDQFVASDSNIRVHPRYTDVRDFHISFNRSSHPEFIFLFKFFIGFFARIIALTKIENMNNFCRCALNRLKYHVFILIIRQVKLHDLKHSILHAVFKCLLAEFTF